MVLLSAEEVELESLERAFEAASKSELPAMTKVRGEGEDINK